MDAYIRVSKTGDRTEDESTEVYEARLREWSRTTGTPLGLVLDDTDVSGSVAVADRKLERLVRRVEDGVSSGIVTPYLDRFGRDLIEGAVALKRITEAGGRLVSVTDGFDSAHPGSNLNFNLRMSIAQDFLERNRQNWQAAVGAAADRGAYLARRPPFGYWWDEGHVLHVDEGRAAVVRELFARRGARRENFGELQRWLRAECSRLGFADGAGISKSGVRQMLKNRAYVGEHRVQSGRRGEPRVLKNHHAAIVTPRQWEGAQWSGGFHARNGATAGAALRGLVYCGTCGRRLRVGTYGKAGAKRVAYTCVQEECEARASIRADWLDEHVARAVQDAAAAGEPHVAAVIEGDTRYEDAMAAVERARAVLEEYRDNHAMQEALGVEDFAAGLRSRREALEAARAALASVPPPDARRDDAPAPTPDAATAAAASRYVGRVVLEPARGRRGLRASERSAVYLAGAAEPYPAAA
jgi:DNA invertase Pin-like site-specific DNA recombinase